MVSQTEDIGWPVEDLAVGLEGGEAHSRAVDADEVDVVFCGEGAPFRGFEAGGGEAVQEEEVVAGEVAVLGEAEEVVVGEGEGLGVWLWGVFGCTVAGG